MEAMKMMGLGATPLPQSVIDYEIPIPPGDTTTTKSGGGFLDSLLNFFSKAEPLIQSGLSIADQFKNKTGIYDPALNLNPGGITTPAEPTFWDKHGTKVLVGSGLALATGTAIYFGTRGKKKKK